MISRGRVFKVLDDGLVKLIDYMGDDSSIVQAARVSYGKGTKKIREDRGLIRYLMRHRHTTPFEMCEIKFLIRVPMDTWRQWIRHRTANVNEYSTRYSIAIDSNMKTAPGSWRIQSEINKQGSTSHLKITLGNNLSKAEEKFHQQSQKVYNERIEAGVAREQARKDLPLSTYTEAYWKIDLHNLLHFLSLRMDSHAQWEIRQYANIIGNEIVAKWVPHVWEAFLDYRLNAITLSSIESRVISKIIEGNPFAAIKIMKEKGIFKKGKKGLVQNRERIELEDKVRTLGLDIPWLKK